MVSTQKVGDLAMSWRTGGTYHSRTCQGKNPEKNPVQFFTDPLLTDPFWPEPIFGPHPKHPIWPPGKKFMCLISWERSQTPESQNTSLVSHGRLHRQWAGEELPHCYPYVTWTRVWFHPGALPTGERNMASPVLSSVILTDEELSTRMNEPLETDSQSSAAPAAMPPSTTKKRAPHKLFRGDFWGQKGGPKRAIVGHKKFSLLFFFSCSGEVWGTSENGWLLESTVREVLGKSPRNFSGKWEESLWEVQGLSRGFSWKISLNSDDFCKSFETKRKGGFVKGWFWRMCPRSRFRVFWYRGNTLRIFQGYF